MSRYAFCLLTLTFLLLMPALAAEASTPSTPRAPEIGADPGLLTKTLKCRVTNVEADRVVTFYDIERERQVRIQLGTKVKIEARSKKQFGRKKLDFGYLAKGQEVKVSVRTDTGEITRVTILPVKKST